ncbi:conserved hypothetical protein [Pseudomonas sp. 8Z]|uniref:zeta toxin family protein n=1 Tax=Pseudomonas sp. 8Z TaxID=2653166 RepID=UPI0012F35A72|nr:zeta toxin family protein [Pseudomonas sp. 8Z]VXC27129.1 conserved hypothetical protein [Pseudomonas sp. 8Z]
MTTPRLRVFAGPNGSGKSTIKGLVPLELINIYVNADDIEKAAKETGFVDLRAYGIVSTTAALRVFFEQHHLTVKEGLQAESRCLVMDEGRIDFRKIKKINSYHASVLADFIRQRLLNQKQSFTFETVMSHESKVEFMRDAQLRGYRTYLYFVATEDPEININRVAIRVKENGHDVDADKIVKRYYKTLALLPSAVAASNRAYIFDNSGEESVWLAEITDGTSLEYRSEEIPEWFFDAYIDQVTSPGV